MIRIDINRCSGRYSGVLLILVLPTVVFGLARVVGAEPRHVTPAQVEFDVFAQSSAEVEFTVSDFWGQLDIVPEGLGPIGVSPKTLVVDSDAGPATVKLRFYGDPT